MILYHAISSYQLLEVMLHRMTREKKERAILILPDFITKKYPQYKKLEDEDFFEKVYLFPYLNIPHRKENEILKDVVNAYERIIPYRLDEFSKIYVAGAHFYFSLLLIKENKKFIFFEDAAGMLSRADELYDNLKKTFPIHAEIAKKYSLFDGKNTYIKKIICLKRAQKCNTDNKIYEDFCVENVLRKMFFYKRRKVVKFFISEAIETKAKIILLTEQFSNLGIMSLYEQEQKYFALKSVLDKNIVIIKKHPDDTMDYTKIFNKVEIIQQSFPAELLPYVFKKNPTTIITFSSTSCENLQKNFKIVKL